MSSEDRPALVAALIAALREVSGQGALYSQAVADRLGINSTDLECLGYLTDGPMTAGALAQATGLTTGAITGVVDRLERAGYARRERDAEDRRKVLVQASPLALERVWPMFEPIERATVEALGAYRDEDLVLLLDFLGRARRIGTDALAALKDGPPVQSKR